MRKVVCGKKCKAKDRLDDVVDKTIEMAEARGMIEVLRCERCGRPVYFRKRDEPNECSSDKPSAE
jgi:hypothetical protein